ncbi:hypothetical protein ACFFV7_09520 [Nonomuraea spiralis]|uniref:Uncharacterized protein n=1 Tax=Nonomuraea spiralis TaxID=46182 RepID=A0ABV5IA61_9ACTN|nr:hypothetical protein [Nonomuraea spiralis]GGT04893.1 hypothetical protein GCM10010176_056550 [Nonomuraea spiralis]
MSDQQKNGAGAQPTGQQPNGAGAQPTGQQPYGQYGIPMSTQVPLPSSGISFTDGALNAASGQINGQTAIIDTLRAKSGHMGVPFPGFGVIGYGLTKAHDRAIAAQSTALERGKKALQSWQAALKAADANYHAAEEANAGLYRKDEEYDPTGGGVPTPKMPESPELNMPDADPPGGDLPDADLPVPDRPDTDLPGTEPPNGDLPNGDRPGSDLPGSDLPGIDRPDSGLSGAGDPNMKVPDIDSAINSPQDTTGLSSYDPRALNGTPNPNLTDLSTRPGTTWGSPTGNGAGSGGGAAAGPRVPGMGTSGAGGMGSGMPMMPMMPTAGSGNGLDERDRQEGSLLSEDEGVWEDDEDIAPEIIGKEA